MDGMSELATPPNDHASYFEDIDSLINTNGIFRNNQGYYSTGSLINGLFKLQGGFHKKPECSWYASAEHPILDRIERAILINSLFANDNPAPTKDFCRQSETTLNENLSKEGQRTYGAPCVLIDTESNDEAVGGIKAIGNRTLYLSGTRNSLGLNEYNLQKGFFYEIPGEEHLELGSRISIRELMAHINGEWRSRTEKDNYIVYKPILGRMSLFTLPSEVRAQIPETVTVTEQQIDDQFKALNQHIIDHGVHYF
jgi:hypothetical protein